MGRVGGQGGFGPKVNKGGVPPILYFFHPYVQNYKLMLVSVLFFVCLYITKVFLTII